MQASPWKRGTMSTTESWLREAAEAFSISVKYSKGGSYRPGQYKTKDKVVGEVIDAVHRHRRYADAERAATEYWKVSLNECRTFIAALDTDDLRNRLQASWV